MEKSGQVKIIFGDSSPGTPRCPHGPALLMERAGDRFYACSAYRYLTTTSNILVSRFTV
jgi:hypothetical protein